MMRSLRRMCRRCTAFVLSLVVVVMMVSVGGTGVLTADAVSDYTQRAGLMLNFFHDLNSDGKVSDLTPSEVRAMAILLSNAFVPFATDLSAVDSDIEVNGKDINVWKEFCDLWNRSTSDTLLNEFLKKKYEIVINSGGDEYPLYLGISGKNGKYSTKATVSSLINSHIASGNQSVYLQVDGSAETVDISKGGKRVALFWYTDGDISADNCHEVFYPLCSEQHHFIMTQILSILPQLSNDDEEQAEGLYITSFGDIYYKDGGKKIVVIPACLNPTAYGDGFKKLPINNSFFLGSLATSATTVLNGAWDSIKGDLGNLYAKFWEAKDYHSLRIDGDNGTVPATVMGISEESGGTDWKSRYREYKKDLSSMTGLKSDFFSVKTVDDLKNAYSDLYNNIIAKSGSKESGLRSINGELLSGLFFDKFVDYENEDLWNSVANFCSSNLSVDYGDGLYSQAWSPEKWRNDGVTGVYWDNRSTSLDFLVPVESSGTFGGLFFKVKEGSENAYNTFLSSLGSDTNGRDYLIAFLYMRWSCIRGMSSRTVGNRVASYNPGFRVLKELSEADGNRSKLGVVSIPKGYSDKMKVGTTELSVTTTDLTFGDNTKESKYLSLYSGIWSTDNAKTAVWWHNQWWNVTNFFVNGEDTFNKLTFIQVPYSEDIVFDKIALFGSGTTGINNSWNDSPINIIKHASVFADDLGATTLFSQSKIGMQSGNTMAVEEKLYTSKLGTLEGTKYSANGSSVAMYGALWAGLFWEYLETVSDVKAEEDGIHNSGSVPTFNNLPPMDTGGLATSLFEMLESGGTDSDSKTDEMQADIISWTYQILDVTNSVTNDYRISWLKNLVDSVFIGMHNAIVGVDISGAITSVGNASDSGVYSTAVGYISTPLFSELPVTGWILEHYTTVYIVLMLLVAVVLVVMVMARMREFPKAVLIFLSMAIILVLPVEALNVSIVWSNDIAENIYSDKFTYWAVVQQARYYNDVAKSSSDGLGERMVQLVANGKTQKDSGGITLKWLAPKKNGLNTLLHSRFKAVTGVSLFAELAGNVLDGEEYVASASSDANYLYRTYYSIYSSASQGHSMIVAPSTVDRYKDRGKTTDSLTTDIKSAFSEMDWFKGSGWDAMHTFTSLDGDSNTMRSVFGGTNTQDGITYPAGYYNGYLNSASLANATRNKYDNQYRIYSLYASDALADAVFSFDTETDDRYAVGGLDIDGLQSTGNSNEVQVDAFLNSFVNYTESPYYYFYNVFNDVVSDGVQGAKDFVKVLLSKDFFEVGDESNPAYGEVKDYLDLEGLFTYVIPYLNYANKDVISYQQRFGLDVKYSDFATDEEYQKAKDQLQKVWNLYSPWVDCLYGLMGASQKVNSGYGRVTVAEPLNPASYYKQSRPMSFSPADAIIKGYQDMDLSTVEYKMHNVLRNTRSDLEELINYKDFTAIGDGTSVNGQEILISAAAMLATFHFNQEFSDHRVLEGGDQLYPQSFELKNMNYDSYLRLILGNATGGVVNLESDSSIYADVIHQTSFVTAVIMIAVDVMGAFVIPLMKIILILVLFGLSLFLAFSCIANPPKNILRTVLMTFGLPLVLFILLSSVHALVVSWFIGNGVQGVVDYRGVSISTGDPTITLLLLLVVDVATAYLMWRILSKASKETARFIKSGIFGTLAVMGAGATMLGNGLQTGLGYATHGVGSVAGFVGRKVFHQGNDGTKYAVNRLNRTVQSSNGGMNGMGSGAGVRSNGGVQSANVDKAPIPKVMATPSGMTDGASYSKSNGTSQSKATSISNSTSGSGRNGGTHSVPTSVSRGGRSGGKRKREWTSEPKSENDTPPQSENMRKLRLRNYAIGYNKELERKLQRGEITEAQAKKRRLKIPPEVKFDWKSELTPEQKTQMLLEDRRQRLAGDRDFNVKFALEMRERAAQSGIKAQRERYSDFAEGAMKDYSDSFLDVGGLSTNTRQKLDRKKRGKK